MAFSTRYLDEYQDELRLDLKDGSTLWSNGELDRAVQRAVDDLSRYYALEAAYEHTIIQTVTEEHWTASGVAGGFVELANKPIEPESETITDSSGNACTRDTDYTMDYINGRIAHVAGGELDSGEVDCHASYKKDKLGIDISAIITDLVRIVHVEYPADKVPQQKVNYSIWNDFMYIGSPGATESQARLTDKEHVVIYYEKPHTAPLAAAAPSYPAFLDQVVCVGAGAYALLIKAIQYEHQAVTDFTTAREALVKIKVYLSTNTNFNATAMLEDISTALHAAVVTMAGHADAVLSQLTSAVSISEADINAVYTEQKKFMIATSGYTDIEAETFLEAGDDYINKVNLGADVARLYREYAEVSARLADIAGQVGGNLASLAYAESSSFNAIANSMSAVATSLNASAAAARVLLDNNRSYVEESAAWVAVAMGYATEGARYVEIAQANLVLSDRFRAEGQQRLAEFHRILEDRSQYRKRLASVPVTQPK